MYVGDHDIAGGQIESSAQERLRAFQPDSSSSWCAAVTDEQAMRYAALRIRKADHRYRPPRWFETLEAEALDQTELLPAVTAALDALLPRALAEVRAEEAEQRSQALKRLKRWR